MEYMYAVTCTGSNLLTELSLKRTVLYELVSVFILYILYYSIMSQCSSSTLSLSLVSIQELNTGSILKLVRITGII